ncbi:MAG: hypothetical protein JW881_17180 [Spirochaetales bacterium]|nr:hypothetical protein [Spirochaetales bacterium]
MLSITNIIKEVKLDNLPSPCLSGIRLVDRPEPPGRPGIHNSEIGNTGGRHVSRIAFQRDRYGVYCINAWRPESGPAEITGSRRLSEK